MTKEELNKLLAITIYNINKDIVNYYEFSNEYKIRKASIVVLNYLKDALKQL